MKKTAMLILLYLIGSLFALNHTVTLSDARRIADTNANLLWGADLYPTEPIPYYGPDDKIIAWHFNYSIGKPFPDKALLQQRNSQALEAGDRDLGWGVGEFANMVIGANRNMPVFIEYSKCLSQHYVYAKKLDETATKHFPKGYELTKTYYLDIVDVWYQIRGETETRYINLEPYTQVKTESEFREMIKERPLFWERDDFTEEWEYLLDNGNTISRAEVYIPREDLMPYYEWSYGCTPSSSAMLFAWYDNYLGYGKFIQSHSSRWDPVKEYYNHHLADFHTMLAGEMYTDWQYYGLTLPWNVAQGMYNAVTSRGYTGSFGGVYDFFTPVATLFNGIRNSIDSGYPALSDNWNHTMCAVGYGTWPSRVFVHDPNRSAMRTLTRSVLWRYHWANLTPLNDVNILKLNTLQGGTQWESNDCGELLISGIYYDISWSTTLSPNAYAKIYYNDEGGAPNRWFPITTSTPNDGHYQWLVPTLQGCSYGINSDYCRIKIEVYDSSTHQLLAADGSYGNFKIKGDYNMPLLASSVTLMDNSIPYVKVNHTTSDNWGLVVYKAVYSSNKCDLELYQSPDFYQSLQTSQSNERLNYILINNFQQYPNMYGVKLTPVSESISGQARFTNSEGFTLTPGITYNYNWSTVDLANVYQVYLNPGQYVFTLGKTTSWHNVLIALFAPGSGYYSPGQAVAYSSDSNTLQEVFIHRVTSPGYYALVICNFNASGGFSIRIDDAGKWLGTADTNWFNPANWLGNSVPNLYNDVVIPPGCTNYPVIQAGTNPEIRSISVETNASLTIGAAQMNVHQNMQVYGTINMSSDDSRLSIGDNIFWGSGSSLVGNFNHEIICYKNWEFAFGSTVQLSSGTVVFWGDQDSYVTIRSSVSRFNNVTINKSVAGRSVFFSEDSNFNWKIYGNLVILNSNSTLRSDSEHRILLFNPVTNYGHIQLDYGTLELAANSTFPALSIDSYLNDLIVNTNSVNTLPSNYMIRGNITINSGGIDAGFTTIQLNGNFVNNMGMNGFISLFSTVIFNGYGDQICTNGYFHIMEVNKTNGKVIFTGTDAESSVDIYDWTAGAIEVQQGELTIHDLADNGLYGTYIVSGGKLNVLQDDNQYTDLNGNVYIYSGTMNVYGGNGNSHWPYAANAHLEMQGGVLDFKNRGIQVHNSSYVLTTELRGGAIRTAGSFICNRSDFQHAGEYYLELYGSTDANISMHSSATIYSLIFNKTANRDAVCPPGLDLMTRDGENPPLELRNYDYNRTRNNLVNLISNVYIFGDLILESGIVNLNSYSLTTESDTDYAGGILIMNHPSARLVTYGRFQYGDNAVLDATSGELHFYDQLIFAENSTFQLGTGTTTRFWSEFNKIGNYSSTCQFGQVVIVDQAELEILNVQPVSIAGNLTLLGESILRVNGALNVSGTFTDYEYSYTYVNANMTVNQNFLLSGVLTIDNSTLTINGNLQNLGSLVLNNNGNCTLARAYDGTYHLMDGYYQINGGVFEVTNNGIEFTDNSYFVMNGGTLRSGGDFVSTQLNSFQPAGGTVEFIGDRNASLSCNNGNRFFNLKFSKPGTRNVGVNTDLQINGDLIQHSGYSSLNGYNINVNRDVIINSGRMGASSTNLTDIYVGRNWINNAGSGSFVAGTTIGNGSTVHLVSSGENAVVSTETFYNLIINKQNPVGNIVTVQPSATVRVNRILNIEQGKLKVLDGSILDVNGNFAIMSGGCLLLSQSENGGTFYLAGNFTDHNTINDDNNGFVAFGNCLVVLDGTSDQSLNANYSFLQFYDIRVDKSAGRVMPHSYLAISNNLHLVRGQWYYGQTNLEIHIGRDLTIETAASFNDATGWVKFYRWVDSNITIHGTAAFANIWIDKGGNNFNFTRNTIIGGEPMINLYSGYINLNGHTLQMATGSMYLASTMFLQAGSVLSLGNNSFVEVSTNGRFITQGTQANPVLITSHDGYYDFYIYEYGTIGGSWGIYEKMGSQGIMFEHPNSQVDTATPWNYPTFRNGAPGGSLLTFSSVNITNNVIQNPIFPANTWGGAFNVSRMSSAGSVALLDATGEFSGFLCENDPFDTINWIFTIVPPPPQNVQIHIVADYVYLTWDPVPEATSYNIYRFSGIDDEPELIFTTDVCWSPPIWVEDLRSLFSITTENGY